MLHELFDTTAAARPGAEALRHRGQSLRYAELGDRSHALAAGLAALGIGPGDRVATCMQNRIEVVEVALACSRLGAIFVPANGMLKPRQLEHLLRDSGARVLVAASGGAFALAELLPRCPALETLILCDASAAPEASDGRTRSYEELLAAKPVATGARPASGAAQRPAALLYTSGSTGRSKGVVVSHENLVVGARTVAGYLGNEASDRILVALPLSFDYGFNQVTTAFAVGACAVLTNFSMPTALLNEMAAEGITGLAGVPTMWMHLASVHWPPAVVARLRYLTNSGGALPVAVLNSLRALLPHARIYCMYGLTEAFRSTYLDPAELDEHAGSIGKAIPGQEMLVLRPDGTRCRPEEAGELVHRGSLVTLGYWNDPANTAVRFRPLPEAISPTREIAVYSGDLVRADADGYLYFIGRADHLIKCSGYRISPGEIEEVVAEVEGVVESAVVGLSDEVTGQRVAVALVADDSCADIAEQVRQHCRTQLPLYMVPADVYVLPALPRNPNGKVDRAALGSQLSQLRLPDVAANG